MADFRSSDRGGRDRDSRGGSRSYGGDRREGGRSYGNRDSGSRGGSFGGRGRDDRRESRDRKDLPFCDAICASCGKECKVPFKPTGDKPVYCRACFSKDESHPKNIERAEKSNASSNSGISQDQFKELSKKVDLIIEILTALDDEEDEEDEE